MQQYKSSKGQRLFILGIILVLPLFLIRESKLLLSKKNVVISTENTFYEMNPREVEEHSFVVIVPTSGNGIEIERNIDSLQKLTYPHFRVEYVLFAVEPEVEKALFAFQKTNRSVAVSKTETYAQFLQKYAEIIDRCRDEQIIVHLPASDWFSKTNALEAISVHYQNQDVWLSYPQCMLFPTYHKGSAKKMLQTKSGGAKKVQKAPWMSSHCKTFYARLFKQSHASNTFTENYFLGYSHIEEMLLPVADCAHGHVRFLPEVLYVHTDFHMKNTAAMSLGQFAEQCSRALAKKAASFSAETRKGCDLLIFSKEGPETLLSFLTAAEINVQGIHDIIIFYTEREVGEYDLCKDRYPGYLFFNTSGVTDEDLNETMTEIVREIQKTSKFVIVTQDTMRFTKEISISSGCGKLAETSSGALYYHLGKKEQSNGSLFEKYLPYAAVQFEGGGYYAYNVRQGKGEFYSPDAFCFTLYRCDYLLTLLEKNLLTQGERGSGRVLFNIMPSVKQEK